jgi:FemAB-related protein (PEP-CTERM system-associated)
MLAFRENGQLRVQNLGQTNDSINSLNFDVVGILPLIHLKHFLFGNKLISIPFFDLGGILADEVNIEKALLAEAIRLGQDLNVDSVELRHAEPLTWLAGNDQPVTGGKNIVAADDGLPPVSYVTKSHKVRMLLDLPESAEELMSSFKAKLRSQIKKPMKEGLTVKVGGLELLDDFYKVFAVNMRDLGSPVHSRKLIKTVLEEFTGNSKVVIVYKEKDPLACSFVIGFKNILENPWASSLRQYGRLAPNMLLYWTMLEYACDEGYTQFDFGRSSPDEGTYRFKEQWGAKPTALHWHYISLKEQAGDPGTLEKSRFENLIKFWQKLPVRITKVIGPRIRRHIEL